MPCRDWTVNDEYHAEAHRIASLLEPAMCGILTALENQNQLQMVLFSVDWREAGVSKESVEAWWKEHKRKDAQRRKAEAKRVARAAEKQRKREEALAKLTEEERKLLGIK